MITFKLETITPAKARKMLATSDRTGFINRTITASFVSRYAGDMKKGHWQSDTGETIKVTDGGKVIDGCHRLTGIIIAGVSVRMWVCRGVDEAMFQYIDQGNGRDLKDIMGIEGWDNPRELAVTGKMLWRFDRCGNPFAHAGKFNESDGNIYNWILTVEPDLRREWSSYSDLIRKAYSASGKSVPVSLMFYLLYQWKKEDVDTALLFIGYLSELDDECAAPHKSMYFFQKYALELKALQKNGQVATKGRHGDLKEMLLKAADYAWELTTSGRKSVSYTGFKSGLGQRVAAAAKMAA